MRTVNNSQQPDSVINNTSNTDQSTESDQSQNSSNQQPFSSSLRRRILASNTSFPLNPYQQLLEQMNHDFEWGLERSQAVARLRQRMNLINYLSNSRPTNQIIPQLTTTTTTDHTTASDTSTTFNQSRFGPRNLVGTLHQIRNRKAPVNHLHSQSKALVVYCGNDPELGDLRTTGTTPKLLNRQSGCGRLISIRATTPLELSLLSDLKNQSIPQNLPQPDDQNHSRQEMISLKDRLSRHSFVSSDCFPTPNSVGAVDDETRLDFERDQASNPFNSKSFFDTYCKCHLTYLGCLSW
ncbi:expressed protein [Phakopsora pachyrhizi]|uniref:Expressed protein n=1 Tax=Phakopsora pachyrhizi TaxID=170000 RepID=A0AAV0BLD7_PHAPC|nr:expressed protein [Phakopsora pachyrhizi]